MNLNKASGRHKEKYNEKISDMIRVIIGEHDKRESTKKEIIAVITHVAFMQDGQRHGQYLILQKKYGND